MAGEHARVADHLAAARVQLRQPAAHSLGASVARPAHGRARWGRNPLPAASSAGKRATDGRRAVTLGRPMALVVTARTTVEARPAVVRAPFSKVALGVAGVYGAALVADSLARF